MSTNVAEANGQVVLDTPAMVYDRVFAYYDVICDKKRKERRVVSRSAAAGLPRTAGAKLGGDKKVERLRDLLENGFTDDRNKPIVRSREQRMLHEIYIRTCLAKLYQDEWDDNRERILAHYEVEEFQQETLVVMPRRAGKTWSMAMFCAAMLLVCPDIEISVFSTGPRTAGKLLKLIVKMLRRLIAYVGEDEFKWLQENEQIIKLLGPDGSERTCGCYPGSVRVSNVLFHCCCGLSDGRWRLYCGGASASMPSGTYQRACSMATCANVSLRTLLFMRRTLSTSEMCMVADTGMLLNRTSL